MLSVVVMPMIPVLAVVVVVVVAVLIGMKSRSWRWAVKMYRLGRQGVRYVNRQAVQYLDRVSSDFPQQKA